MRGGAPFDTALEQALAGLAHRDRRLAHEIAAGVLRGRRALDRQLAPLVRAGWRRTAADVKDLLRIGAYQLLRLTRVPPYAAVQATVEVAKASHGREGAGLVNAVLRRLATRRDAALVSQPEGFSHPAWLVERWTARYGPARTEVLQRHNDTRPPLVLQPARWSPARLREALEAAGVACRPAPLGQGLAVEARQVRALPGYTEGGFIVQDPAPARLVRFAAIPPGVTVWDACAAPGGKAVTLARDCRVVASDRRPSRMARLAETVARAAPTVHLFVADARRPPIRPGTFAAVVVDAPCSATGTMARHPDARWRLTPTRLRRLVALQADILDGAAAAVRPGGLLVYLTCSLEPEENAEQVNRFLERHPAFGRAGDDVHLFPPDHGTDGGYGARLRRDA